MRLCNNGPYQHLINNILKWLKIHCLHWIISMQQTYIHIFMVIIMSSKLDQCNIDLVIYSCLSCLFKDHSGYVLSQWEAMLQCNVVFHWLSPYPEHPCLSGRHLLGDSLSPVKNHSDLQQLAEYYFQSVTENWINLLALYIIHRCFNYLRVSPYAMRGFFITHRSPVDSPHTGPVRRKPFQI